MGARRGGGGPKLRNITAGPVLEASFASDIQSLCYQITNVMLNGTDGVTVRVNTGGPGIGGCDPDDPLTPGNQLQPAGDTVLIAGLGFGNQAGSPVSANGRWVTSSVVPVVGSTALYDVTLTGASWAGPMASGAAWKAGAPVITVTDNTNVIPGQYICASGTPPFCTPPSGFGFSAASASNINSIGTGTGTVTITTGTTAGWPVSGMARVGSEDMLYTVKSTTTFDVTKRGVNGTTAASHGSLDPITPAAPTVLSVPPPVVAAGPTVSNPASEAVIVSAPAQNTGSGNVTFANDTTLWLQTGTTSYGQLYLDPSYRTWTANTGGGSSPSGTVNVNTTANSSVPKLIPAADLWKIQPGMLAIDLTSGHSGYLAHNAPDGGPSCSLPGVILGPPNGDGSFALAAGSCVSSSFTGADLVQFSGCGYPGLNTSSAEPWLGNCAATALLLGGTGVKNDETTEDDEVQGTFCDTIKSGAIEIAIHSLDAPATVCSNLIAESNTNSTLRYSDPDSVALWLDGDATKSQYSNARLGGGFNAILDTPDIHGQPDGVGIVNMQTENNIALGAGANATVVAAHGDSSLANPTLLASSGVARAQMSSIDLPGWSVVTDDPAAFPNLYCAGNVFLTAPCSQVKGTPTCGLGCTSVSGDDSNFDVKPSSSSSVTIQLAGAYTVPPICSVSAGTASGGAVGSASVNADTWNPWGTTLTVSLSGSPAHVYGSCRGATA